MRSPQLVAAVDNFELDDLVSTFDQMAIVTECMQMLVSGHEKGCHVENRSVLAIRQRGDPFRLRRYNRQGQGGST